MSLEIYKQFTGDSELIGWYTREFVIPLTAWRNYTMASNRDPLTVKAILRDPHLAIQLAQKNDKRYPSAESSIARHPELAYTYATNVIRGRFPEAETTLATDGYWAAVYAAYALQKRWPAAEPIISKDACGAHIYAAVVLRDRWPEAEPVIMADTFYRGMYIMDMREHGIDVDDLI